ncbi:MAG: hypothetical protein CL661_08460 [Bacteroidetes bacterium]|jgi:hypothetical protein|nr:hypothetical protein [Bacteroidota bacterium]|tara:strand:- start:917 stop:1579 length:663 start_codon:yes stop_codon:yes gene_type:complete
MKLVMKNPTRILMFLLAAIIITSGASSCKSKKKLAREKAAAEYKMKVEQSKKDLTAMLNGTTNWSLDEQDKRLEVIKSYNIDDPEVNDLISKVESKLSTDRADAERQAEEERLKREEEKRAMVAASKYQEIDNQLIAIANATNTDDANEQINLILQQFATPDIPVLIIISKAGGFNDYDRPTTISMFLNYLKDKKQYFYKVDAVKHDGLGKITELELIKN